MQRSTSRITITLNNVSMFWASKRQTLIALSSTETEYLYINSCVKVILWLQRLFWILCYHCTKTYAPYLSLTNALTGSTDAILLIFTPTVSEKNKQINLKWQIIRDRYNECILSINIIQTTNQAKEIFTKPVIFSLRTIFCSFLICYTNPNIYTRDMKHFFVFSCFLGCLYVWLLFLFLSLFHHNRYFTICIWIFILCMTTLSLPSANSNVF